MGNTATRRAREQRNNTTATLVDGKLSSSVVAACAAAAQDDEEGTRNHRSWDNKARKSIANTTITTTATTTAKSSNITESGGVPATSSSSLSTRKYVTKNAAAGGGGGGEVSAATVTAQRQRQTSVWSLGSLSGRFNWSFRSAGATKASGSSASFHHRPKTLRKSLSSVQLKRSRTTWPRPVTSSIFSTHFKTASRNDEFSIVHLIAKGAFGAVFKVTDKRRRQQQQQHHDSGRNQGEADGSEAASASQFYALKVLKKSKVIVEHSVGQLKDEADIQKACGHHSFIVRQIDSWQNRHNLHILSEYLPNGELFSKFATFSLDLVRLYLAEIALAIDFLHHAGIIYRDAKPENILLTQSYHLKLTDFGLSKWLKLGAQTKTMCGTLQYMGTI